MCVCEQRGMEEEEGAGRNEGERKRWKGTEGEKGQQTRMET